MSLPVTVSATVPSRRELTRTGIGLLLGTLAYIVPFNAVATVLLPARIAEIAPDHKVALLAVATSAAAVAALVSNVVFGALSDRTRSRFGARAPWIVGGAVASAAVLVVMAFSTSLAGLLIWWCVVVASSNAVTAAVLAILPDRVPAGRRATLSAVIGVGVLLGHAIGTVIGATLLHDVRTGVLVVAGLMVVLALLSVAVAPDRSNLRDARPVSDPRIRLAFRPPRNAPDFYWALWGRLALVLGYFMINGFQFYIFTDYIGLDQGATARALALNSVLFLVAALAGAAVGPLSDRLRRRKSFVIGSSLMALVAVAVPFAVPTPTGMIAFGILGGLCFGVYYSVDAALMTEVLPSSESRARDLGILNIATTGGQALAPATSSALVGLGLGFGPVFIGAMVTCVLAAALIVPIRSVR